MAKVFIAHASENKDLALDIYYALTKKGMEVYLDEKSLEPGEQFHTRLRELILESKYFVFLVSRYSVSEHSYCLTELEYAEEKWAKGAAGFIPVMIDEVGDVALPAFIRQSNFMRPKGNVISEVTSEILSQEQEWSNSNEIARTTAEKGSIWKQIEGVPPLVTSLIALFAAVAGLTIWVFGYFASQKQLLDVRQEGTEAIETIRQQVEAARCLAHLHNYILDRKIDQKVSYDELVRNESLAFHLEEQQKTRALSSVESQSRIDAQAKANTYREEITNARARENEAKRILSSTDLLDNNGKCKL